METHRTAKIPESYNTPAATVAIINVNDTDRVLGARVRHNGVDLGRVRKSADRSSRGWWVSLPAYGRSSGPIFRTRNAAIQSLLRSERTVR